MINFGAGKLIAIPTNDATGAAIANPTPVVLAVLQDVSVDLSVELKTLYGNKRYPVAIGQGKGKTEIKAKYADINGGVLGSLFYGKTATAGIKAAVLDFSATIPSTPFQITIAPPSSGTFVTDLGVLIAGIAATRVATAPAAGQYSVNTGTGVYTFNTADASKTALISYEYSAASGGQVFALTNDIMGVTPSFTTLLQSSYDGKTLVMKLNRCVSGKLNVPLKNDDFAMYDFEAEAFEDSAGSLGYICLF